MPGRRLGRLFGVWKIISCVCFVGDAALCRNFDLIDGVNREGVGLLVFGEVPCRGAVLVGEDVRLPTSVYPSSDKARGSGELGDESLLVIVVSKSPCACSIEH